MKTVAHWLVFWVMVSYCAMAQQVSTYADSLEKHRDNYREDFLKSAGSPLKQEDLSFLRFYEANPKLKIQAHFELTPDAEPFTMATSDGKRTAYVKFGIVSFKVNNKTYQLSVYRSPALMKMPDYRDYVFIPFRDGTSGKETYGGGRYLDFRLRDFQNGHVTIDFNKAYNPYCAYSDGYSCPIPPRENHLTVRLEAGEKNYGKER
jgi:uncharacterized protein